MRRRIVSLYLVLAVIVSSLVAYITYRYSYEVYIKEMKTGLQHEAILVDRIFRYRGLNEVSDLFLKELSEDLTSKDKEDGEGYPSRRITLIDKKGKVLADSTVDSSLMENHSDRKEVVNALQNGTGTDIRKSETTSLNLIYLAYYSKDLDLIVRISASVEHINEIRDTILFYALIAIVVGLVLSSLIVIKLSDYAVRPVARLVKEYGGVAYAPYDDRHKDEVGQLSTALSSMTRHIENIIRELKDRNARVDTIINSMDNGLIAVDRSMHILMLNPVANRIFGSSGRSSLIGVPLVQVIRNQKINELLIKAIADNRVLNDEIHLFQGTKRIFSIHVSPIYPMDEQSLNSGALVHIHEVTQVRKLEEMRSEFVSNVTHELKTPLTSIQGFVETLKSGAVHDAATAEGFLDIISIEADRLNNLINDILELSEIEHKRQDDKQVFKLLPLVQEVLSMLENSANEKKVTLESRMDPELSIEANPHRIKQLLINLIDNAIKYNRQAGSVWVSAELSGDRIAIHVKDTGIGIPSAHTGRIFERFYRVDKGRSREMGGTGLGLSIVKHIAQLYGGSVRVESEEGVGSEFTVILPAPKSDK